MPITDCAFDGVSFFYYSPLVEDRARPMVVRPTIGGSKVTFTAPYVADDIVRWRGIMTAAQYASLKAKMEASTIGTLSGTYGSCSAQIVELPRAERSGFKTGVDHFLEASIAFLKITQWA